MLFWFRPASLGIVAALCALPAQATFVVDRFIEPTSPLQSLFAGNPGAPFNINPASDTKTGLSGTVGGSRQIDLRVTSSGILDFASAFVSVSDGSIEISNTASGLSEVSLTWDADGAGFNNGNGLDITDSGTNLGIAMFLPVAVDIGMELEISLFDTSGNESFITSSLPDGFSGLNLLPFFGASGFQARGLAQADLSLTTSMSMTLSSPAGAPGADYRFQFVDIRPNAPAAPLPATLILLLPGLLLLAKVRASNRT